MVHGGVPPWMPPVGGTRWWWVCTMYVQGVVDPPRGAQGGIWVSGQGPCIQGCTWLYPHIVVYRGTGYTPYGHPQGWYPVTPCTLIVGDVPLPLYTMYPLYHHMRVYHSTMYPTYTPLVPTYMHMRVCTYMYMVVCVHVCVYEGWYMVCMYTGMCVYGVTTTQRGYKGSYGVPPCTPPDTPIWGDGHVTT